MKVRKALKTDVVDVYELTGELGYVVDKKSFNTSFDSLIDNQGHAVFVAEDSGRVVAYIHVLLKELLITMDTVEIGELIVHEKYQRKGIGRQLVAMAENWATENGYKNVVVGSSNKRTVSHLFYQKIGICYWKEQKLYNKALLIHSPKTRAY
jgi:GNAT superfamily N-acetyltransferase